MPEGKWIPDLHADTPVAEAARLALRARLTVVREHLELALQAPEQDSEHVHQLRVGTRRARAALDIFAFTLTEKKYRRARRQLRRLRRAAGLARDWDVFLATLAEHTPQPGADFLFGYALGQRLAAQEVVARAGRDFPHGFGNFVSNIVEAVHEPRSNHRARLLRDLGPPLLADLLQQLNLAAGSNLKDYGHLHRVRIIGKRLRYAMEIFVACFAEPFRAQLYPAVEEMQEILGRANDSHVALQHLGLLREKLRHGWPKEWKRHKSAIDDLRRFHQTRLPLERRNFLKWWKNWQSSKADVTFATLLKEPEPVES